MDFLRFLEGLRHPTVSAFMSAITYCGHEVFFMVVALTVFWCVSRRDGYYILLVGFLGTVSNQFLKLFFRVPRPWILDPEFTIVESARAAATGYSFPSGHTQNIVGTMACVCLITKKKYIRAIAVALMVLVPFSRMYLGCHTPMDVGAAFVLALTLAFGLRPLFAEGTGMPRLMRRLLSVSLAAGLLYWSFAMFYAFPEDIDPDNLYEGIKNAHTLLGCLVGLIVVKAIEERHTDFRVDGVWWAQVLKTVLGLGLILALRAGLKAPLQTLIPEHWDTAARYCIIVVFAGAVWPLTFPWFARLGKTGLDEKRSET